MDFDEYEYLENSVGNLETSKLKDESRGGEPTIELAHKHQSHNLKHRKHRSDGNISDHGERSLLGHTSPTDRERSERDRHRSNQEHNRDKLEGYKRGRNRDEDQERDRGREKIERKREYKREEDRKKEHNRSNPRSRSERYGNESSKERSRDKEINQVKEHRETEELREWDLQRRRYKEKKEEAAEPEADPERDQRTVFAYQISLKADEKDVYEFFSKAGKVRDVRLIMDRLSRRSKGFGYIEFYDVMSVPMAIALSGQPLLGHPVMVKPSEAEKNLVQPTPSMASAAGALIGSQSDAARKLYVGNLHLSIKEDQLRQVFEPFGTIELVQLPADPATGNCKGYGFIQFARHEDARAAESLNEQLEIAGRVIKVSAVTPQDRMPDVGGLPGDLDDDENGGLSFKACSRALLMQKLDRSGTATSASIAGPLGSPVVNGTGVSIPATFFVGTVPTVSLAVGPIGLAPAPSLAGLALPIEGLTAPADIVPSFDTIGIPSECLLLNNMFDSKLESEPDFDLDIKEDVRDECSKFGTLKHIFVDKDSAGFVYLRFESTQSAASAQHALHGRWFAGKMITATFMEPQNYEAKFPDSG